MVLHKRTPGVELTDLSARALGVVGGVRPDEGMSGESDAVRLEVTWAFRRQCQPRAEDSGGGGGTAG